MRQLFGLCALVATLGAAGGCVEEEGLDAAAIASEVATGEPAASPDGGPGPTTACKGPSPAATCRTSADQCIPSSCGCSEGRWVCTADCGGGKSCGGGEPPPTTCKEPNPAATCRAAADQCIPSSCGCSDGRWVCTRDCGGGSSCSAPPAGRR